MKLKKDWKSRCEKDGHLFKEARYIFNQKIAHGLYCIVCGEAKTGEKI
jgi:hypothetical protein